MKPILLELKNFGPYVAETVDFKQFTSTPLFLITGKTGSGKSTLFDAMCYALYGRTSGNQRTPEQMRADFALPTAPTSVYFIFEHQGLKYEIKRMPAQELQAKRGKKLVSKKSSVSLTYTDIDGQVIELTKTRDVQEFISNLLELTAEQFVQIILLPQGKFQTFLMADSNKKEEVLRDLFGTRLFKNWITKIQVNAKQYQEKNRELTIKLQQIKQQVNLVDSQITPFELWHQTLQTKLASLQSDFKQQAQSVKVANEKVENLVRQYENEKNILQLFEQLATVTTTLTQLEQQQTQITILEKEVARLKWLQTKEAKLVAWQNKQQQLQQQKEKLQKLTQEKQQLETQKQQILDKWQLLIQKQPAMTQLQAKIQKLQASQEILHTLADLQKQFESKQTQATTLAKQTQHLQATLTLQQQERQNLQAKLAQFAQLEEQKISWQQQQLKLEKQTQLLKNLQQTITQISSQADNANQTKDTWQKQVQKVNRLTEQLKQSKSDYAARQIAQLAQELLPNTPCPVCGSCDHPQIAQITVENVITKQQLEQLQITYEQETEQLNILQGNLQSQQSYLESLQQQYQEALKNASDVWGSKTSLSLAQLTKLHYQALQTQQQQEKYLLQQNQNLQKLQASLTQLDDLLAQTQLNLQEYSDKQNHLKQELAILTGRIQEQQKQVPKEYLTCLDLDNTLKKLQQELAEFEQAYQQTTTAKEQHALQYAQNQSLLVEMQHQITKLQHDYQQQKLELNEALTQTDLIADLTQMQALLPKLATLETKQQKLNRYQLDWQLNQQTKHDLQEKIAKKTRPDLLMTQAALKQAKDNFQKLQTQYNQQYQNYQLNQQLFEQSQVIMQQQATLTQEIEEYLQLSETLSGKNTLKLGFERYVLQNKFKDVLEIANQRLVKLTAGRYLLCLDEQTGNAMLNTGLELNVYDDHLGKQRSVKTLSGGECFIAALCLALALGEIIQNQNGGVKIDALFVDEGFGSLDSEALNTALNVLQTIEGQQKMIGIISHVQELRERIADKLIIKNVDGKSQISYQHEF